MKQNIAIIGSGFSSLSAACYLAKAGHNVTVYEKNNSLGGRARQFKAEGFTFDMGPSWYWMPDVFERFFNDFGKSRSDFYSLERLNPGYRVVFDKENQIQIGDDIEKISVEFEKIEKGSGKKLKDFIEKAKNNYDLAVTNMLYKMPGKSIFELINIDTVFKVNLFFKNIKNDVEKTFKDQRLRSILQFPVLFLGAKPSNTPAFYNFMNYADFGLGTWQPKNGFFDVVRAMVDIGKHNGVNFHTNCDVQEIKVVNSEIDGIIINGEYKKCDILISGADYEHTESLLKEKYKQYSENYWKSRTWSPSSLLFYLGLNKKLKNLDHHNLFFDTDFDKHADEIYSKPKWPTDPLFYLNITSKTNSHTAPPGNENCFILIPIATDLEDNEELREKYFKIILKRIKDVSGNDIEKNIVYKRSYCINDFKKDYNSYGGNAYGLANTLMQTAFLRPKLQSKKVKKLYFSGQLSVPGPGVPPAIVSGKLVSDIILKNERAI